MENKASLRFQGNPSERQVACEIMVQKLRILGKASHIDKNPGFLWSPVLVGYPFEKLENIYLLFRTVARVPVCLLAEPVFPQQVPELGH